MTADSTQPRLEMAMPLNLLPGSASITQSMPEHIFSRNSSKPISGSMAAWVTPYCVPSSPTPATKSPWCVISTPMVIMESGTTSISSALRPITVSSVPAIRITPALKNSLTRLVTVILLRPLHLWRSSRENVLWVQASFNMTVLFIVFVVWLFIAQFLAPCRILRLC